MTDDTKHKIGDKSAQPGDGAPKLDNPETKELVNAGGTAMRGIESTRTNKSSGSFDESQEMSIEIDFGNGHRESRRNNGAGETGQPTETTKPSREQLKHETLGALIPLAQVADVEAFPVLQSQPGHADVSKFPQPQPLPFRPELKPLPIPILPKDGPSPILHPPHPETAAKASLEPPLPRPNGPVYVDRTVPSPLLHQSHAQEAASVESAALQAVVPRGADSGVIEGARDLPLSPKDQPIAGYSPETHDKNGFVKDPVGYGLMLAQQVKPGDVRTDVAPPPAPVPTRAPDSQHKESESAPKPASFIPPANPTFRPPVLTPSIEKASPVSKFLPAPELSKAEKQASEMQLLLARQKEKQDAEDVLNLSKRTLEVNARAAITNKTECDQFLADMRDFEKGYVERTPLDRAKALLEIAETYKQVDRLLTATNDAIPHTKESAQKPGDTPWRVQIAEQIMHHAADPTSVSQGVLAVCTTASLQIRQYYRSPSAVARLVSDVTLSGKYETSADGRELEIERKPNLVPDGSSRFYSIQNWVNNKPSRFYEGEREDSRSFASQIYDVTAMNLHLLAQGKGYRYRLPTESEILAATQDERHKEQGGVYTPAGIFIKWKETTGKGIRPGEEDISNLNRLILGRFEPGFVIVCGDLTSLEASNPLTKEIADFVSMPYPRYNLYSAGDLAKSLFQIRQSNQWPPIAHVNTLLPPFSQQEGGPHSIVITDISPDGSKISYDNTWRKSKDYTGQPSVSTRVIGDNIRSAISTKISFATRGENAKFLIEQSTGSNWTRQRAELKKMAASLGANGLEPDNKIHKALLTDDYVKQWRDENPWDLNLLGWKRSVEFLMDKYPR
jgi:hypothetical protein